MKKIEQLNPNNNDDADWGEYDRPIYNIGLKIEPKAIAEKIGQFATSFGSNLVAISRDLHDACVTELFGQFSDYRRLVVIMQFRLGCVCSKTHVRMWVNHFLTSRINLGIGYAKMKSADRKVCAFLFPNI